MKRQKGMMAVAKQIKNSNGLTNPTIAAQQTGYSYRFVKAIFDKIAIKDGDLYYLTEDMEQTLNWICSHNKKVKK